MWRRIRAETGFHDLRIHDLRRTVGSWLVRDGASLHLVGAVLNHKDQKTTAGYAYFQTEDRQKVLDRHGRKIVQIAKGGVRSRANPKSAVSAPAEEQTRKRPRVHRISRKDLYRLIWSEPITALAERFGISDVGLAKVCRRSDIPAPPRGYWAKTDAGGKFQRPDLPDREDLKSRRIRFRTSRGPIQQNATTSAKAPPLGANAQHRSSPPPKCFRFSKSPPDPVIVKLTTSKTAVQWPPLRLRSRMIRTWVCLGDCTRTARTPDTLLKSVRANSFPRSRVVALPLHHREKRTALPPRVDRRVDSRSQSLASAATLSATRHTCGA